ncbi:universal stress protein [Variovorax sp. PAMC 28711]|uniref:universal stress protein n=1 Tax=Variovorax sp. PAMC 28711 TaxID=1795631 RepID=UPI00078C2781|nr:universal stress protein [Variovorax sp. PAMC 28711]AMM23508.1 hypothetical protein AX767_03425 [Variovorax sp. PAMC 28711]
MLGAKGRGAFADLLMGSVAQRVLATARQPVVLVKQRAGALGVAAHRPGLSRARCSGFATRGAMQ